MSYFSEHYFSGLIDLPWWGYVLVALVFTHITIATVTIYLHRCQAHRALDLHPVVSHFFRFWVWLTTGMVTKEWAAIHRKHHAKVETAEDPHSPQVCGLRKVLWEGTELYKREAKNPETLENYGHGTPDDWLEHHLYGKYSILGISIMAVIDFVLFGFIGVTIWAVQMMWIPFFAAGVINGVGHFWGYRNFACADASTNIVPWGILIGGEELHNNHHAYVTSARLSNKWYEFDIGWLYIRIMEIFGFAEVKKIAPKIRFNFTKAQCDDETLEAVITHRYDVLAKFAQSVKQTYAEEIRKLRERAAQFDGQTLKNIKKRWLHQDAKFLKAQERAKLDEALSKSKVLETIYSMRQELTALWQRSAASKEQLLKQLQDWCARAEKSGIASLQEFSRKLRCYA
ncbi:MAG TPA: fatty acid desaturase [Burkholderiales bacterium]|nr:fatty acid desaturase [Burkholderiales bacterium]